MALTEQEQHIEDRMKTAYEIQVSDALADQKQYRKDGLRLMGIETEYSLIKPDTTQADEHSRDAIINGQKTWLQPELGAAQIELTTSPEPIERSGINHMIDQYITRELYIVSAAKTHGLQVLRNGTNPFIPVNEIVRSSKPKYTAVPNFYNQQRTVTNTNIGKDAQVDIGDLSVISLFNSVQLNIEAKDSDDSIDLINRAIAISPMMVTITGNSRYLDGIDTQISDMRMLAWSKAVDTRTEAERNAGIKETRAGMPDNYYKSLEDYFTKVGTYPFILDYPDAAIDIGVGMYWKDARIKIIGESLVVEPRPIPMQPTAEENIAAILLYLGRLNYSQIEKEALLPMFLAKENKLTAMQDGLDAKMWRQKNGIYVKEQARILLPDEIQKARIGLIKLGLSKEQIQYLDIIEERIETGNPSDKFAKKVSTAENQGANRTQALQYALQ